MGAEEILDILSNAGPLTCLEILEKSNCSKRAVGRAISRLLKDVSAELEFRTLTKEEIIEKYGHKISRKVRIFWIKN